MTGLELISAPPGTVITEKRGDVVYTPLWAASDMVKHFRPSGRLLDPCRGQGVFHDLLLPIDPQARWCEATDGKDFFAFRDRVDWAIGNPPYSLTRDWFRHSYKIADNLLYLVPLRNVFSGYGFLREIHAFGAIREIRVYGTGHLLGFPMGNAVGALWIQRGSRGQTRFTYPAEVPSQEGLFDAAEVDAP